MAAADKLGTAILNEKSKVAVKTPKELIEEKEAAEMEAAEMKTAVKEAVEAFATLSSREMKMARAKVHDRHLIRIRHVRDHVKVVFADTPIWHNHDSLEQFLKTSAWMFELRDVDLSNKNGMREYKLIGLIFCTLHPPEFNYDA